MGREGPGYISKPIQREAIERWAAFRGVEIILWIEDEDESGGTQNRPGLRTAMDMIEAQEADGLACWRLNRFARNVSEAIADVERIHAAGGHLACIEEDIDPTGPFGRFILTILLAVATLERDNLCASFAESKRRALARGACLSRTPIGYRRDDESRITPDPHFGPIVAEAFRLAASDGVTTAAEYLQREVPVSIVKGVEQHRRWNAATTRRVFASRVYLGETVQGEQVLKDTHPALVTRAVWEAAQTSPARRQAHRVFPLSGLPLCATCGQHMVGATGGVHHQRTYRCAGGQTGVKNRCSRPANVTAELIETYVRDEARQRVAGLSATVGVGDGMVALEAALAEAEEELQAFAANQTARRALGGSYDGHLEARADAVEQAQAAYREQAAIAERSVELNLDDLLSADDPMLFQAGLSSIFATVTVRPGRGLKIEDRVLLVPVDPDGATGVASA